MTLVYRANKLVQMDCLTPGPGNYSLETVKNQFNHMNSAFASKVHRN